MTEFELAKLFRTSKVLYVSLAVLLGIQVLSESSLGIPILFNREIGKTEFRAIGKPSAIKIKGVGTGPEGTLEIIESGTFLEVNGSLKFDLRTLETGIKLRDEHLKEKYLEVAKFTFAELFLDKVKISNDLTVTGEEVLIPARLNLHGNEKSVQLKVTIKRVKEAFQVKGSFSIGVSEFQVSTPKWAGITVADRVDLEISTEGKEQVNK